MPDNIVRRLVPRRMASGLSLLTFPRFFERLLDVLIVIGLALLAVTLTERRLSAPPQKPRQGAVFPRVSGISFEDHALTVIVAVSSRCAHCVQDLPFYRTLADRMKRSPKKLQFVLAINPQASHEMAFWRSSNISDVRLAPLPMSSGVAVVPTLIIVDSTGRVLTSVAGRLRSDTEEHVIRLINDLAKPH